MWPCSATCLVFFFIVFAASNQGVGSHPPAEKEKRPHPLEKKEHCPKVCRCPVNPTCPPGSPLAPDTCGCGCKVCAVGLHSSCDGFRPCDASQNLTCDYLRSPKKHVGICHVYPESDKGDASHPPTEKETQPHPPDIKQGCPKTCRCPVNPTCAPGHPLVLDTCGCGCKVCAGRWISRCDGFRPCDASQNLTCYYYPGQKENLGVCNVLREYRSCFNNGKEVVHGASFYHGCTARCDCDDGKLKCEPFCRKYDPPLVDGCSKLRFEKGQGQCCENWSCKEYNAKDTQSSHGRLTVLKSIKEGISPSTTQVDTTRQSCFVDGKEILHGQKFKDGCRNLCICANGQGLCIALCPPTRPEPVPGCVEMQLEAVPGLCCKKWKCKEYKAVDAKVSAEDLRELEANLSLSIPVVVRKYRSCFFDGSEILHRQEVLWKCMGRCECDDGAIACVSPCPPHIKPPVPGCIDARLMFVPGECCLQRICLKYQPVDGNITVETLYHRTSEDEVDDTVQVHERKRRSSREAPHTVYSASNHGVRSHPPAEKGKRPHPLVKKEGCPKVCRCPVNPTCPPGSPLVADNCGCGCKVCAVGLHSTCDGVRPCDASQNLTCDYLRGPKKHVGICNVIREYRSCFNNGTEMGQGDRLFHDCTARCVCDNGKFNCEPICQKYNPPAIPGCGKIRFEKGPGQCCKYWSCIEYIDTNSRSSYNRLIVIKSIEEGRSPSTTQGDKTRQSCFFDGTEVLHAQKFNRGCSQHCICANGSGLCVPLCPETDPEPVPGCVEMHLETVPGLCCKKWKCKEYQTVDTQVSPEVLRELEANLSLNAPVVIRKFRSCFYDGSEIRHQQRYQEGCVGNCRCDDGHSGCVSLCPPYVPAPVPGCIDMRKVEVPGQCCKKYKCLEYQLVDGNITLETLHHRTSEDEVDHTVPAHGGKMKSKREAPQSVYAASNKGDVSQPPTEKEKRPRPLEKKQGCPKACRCPVNPTCAPGSPLVLDTCGCGCKVCGGGWISPCDGFRPCDASQNLTCDYSRGQNKNLGMCNVIREYRSCFNNGTEVIHGDSFYHGCTARCVCDDGKLKCEPFCREYDPPLIDGCSKLRLKKEQCCEHWTCTERTATNTKSSQDGLIVLKSIKKGRSPPITQDDPTRQSCFVDGKEILHGQKFKDGCRHLCICSNGSGLCLPLCPTTRPEPVAGCVEMQLEAVPGLCCKKWKCKKYKSVDTKVSAEDLRELEANLGLNAPVVVRKHRSCFSDGSEIRHRQEFQWGCVGRCECMDGGVMCVSLCPPYRPAPVPGCIDMDETEVPGECCMEWKCLKYQPVDGNITVETLYHRTSEDEVDDTVYEKKVYATSDPGEASHPPAEKVKRPHPLEKKEVCPRVCRCPVNPTCSPGSPLVADNCGCGCKVCAVGQHSPCDGFRPCDASQNLTCDYLRSRMRNLGVCHVMREYRSCFNNDTEVVHGDLFFHGCTARCVCDDGKFNCESFCQKYDPPLLSGCRKMHLQKVHCCEHWSCKAYDASSTRSSQSGLSILMSIKNESSPSSTQDDPTRQSCFVDGKEILHGQKFKDGCRHLCICANGSGLCLPLCPSTPPEPVPGCVEMQLEAVQGLCCKKWKCKKYQTVDTQVSPEVLRELEANLSLNAPVVIRKHLSCFSNGLEIRHLQRFYLGCSGSCVCKDGHMGCVSRCPPVGEAPVPGCVDMRYVPVPGECCKQWKCLKYQQVDGNITMETLYHRTSEDEMDDTVQVHGGRIRSRREAPHTADNTSMVQAFSCNKEPTEWTPCSRTCGFGQSFRMIYDPESCSPRAEKRLCIVRPCKSQYSNASYTILKSSKTCNRLVRWQEPLLLNHRGCTSQYPISLRFCGDCVDGRVCTPLSTETRFLGFRCRNNRNVNRRIMWVVNCQCKGKGRNKKKGENNTSEAEVEREGGLVVEEQGLKDGGFGV